MLDKLTFDDFRPVVGQTFALDVDGTGTLDLELLEARSIEPGAPAVDDSGHRTPFALDLRGPVDPILPQRMYRLENETVGALDLFIVPVGRTPAGTDYEAIFT
jgi:hypothetical protein